MATQTADTSHGSTDEDGPLANGYNHGSARHATTASHDGRSRPGNAKGIVVGTKRSVVTSRSWWQQRRFDASRVALPVLPCALDEFAELALKARFTELLGPLAAHLRLEHRPCALERLHRIHD
jgi:hypothetical protein